MTSSEPAKVWLDVDLGLGKFPADVDDALALVMAMNSPELEVVGVSTTYGNVAEPVARHLTRRLLDFYPDRDVQLASGARSPRDAGGGRALPAVGAISRVVEEYPGAVTLVCLGPLTTAAALLTTCPQVAHDLGRLVVMGGAIVKFGGREFNFQHDPASTDFVLRATTPTWVFGLEVCTAQVFSTRDYAQLVEAGKSSPLARYLATHVWKWLVLNRALQGGGSQKGFYPFDPVATAYLVDPSIFRFAKVPLRHVVPRRLLAYPLQFPALRAYIDAAAPPAIPTAVHYATRLDSAKFKSLLLERLTRRR
ncbi:MAG: ribonucleoside hydrolase RihC [Promethearchaeota archaeon]